MTTREADEAVDDHHQQPTNAKQEGDTDHQIKRTPTKASSSSTGANISAAASSWSRLKDPRIFRVSRALGGKDRHSKVCTVRGLRDRRVRLSVPTAIQLYDLQDRLGLNQPSKVVDWLLNAAKNEIDELPPLPNIPPGSFNQLNLQPILPNSHQSEKDGGGGGLRIGGSTSTANASINWDDPSEPSGSNAWHSDPLFRPKSPKEAAAARNEEGKREESGFESHHHHNAYFSSNNFFSRLDHHHHHHNPSSSTLGLLNSSTMAYNSMIRWDTSNSNLSLSQSAGNSTPGLTVVPQQQQDQDFHNFGVLPLQSSNQQVLVYHQPGGTITQPYFPSHIAAAADYGSSGGGRVPFHLLGTTTKLFPSQNDDHHDHSQEKQDAENNGFHSR